MKKTSLSSGRFYIIVFFLSSAVLLNFVIPPFQNPDEPQHLGIILSFGKGNEKKDEIGKEILSLMHKNEWWKYIGMRKPEIPPDSFSEIDFLNFSDFQLFIGTFLYHFILGKVVNLIFKEDILGSYYFCRFVSIALFLATVLLSGLVFKKLFQKEILRDQGSQPGQNSSNLFLWGVLFILILPQFLILSVSVNPDSLSIFLGALFFYAAFRLVTEKFRISFLVVCSFSAIVGLFTDKSLFFLFFLSLLLPLFLIKKERILSSLGIVFLSFFLSILIASWLTWYYPMQISSTLKLLKVRLLDKFAVIPQIFIANEFNQEFINYIIDSSLLRYGWMAYDAEPIFYYVWRSALFLAFLGVIIYVGKCVLGKVKKVQAKAKNADAKKVLFFSLCALVAQVMGARIFIVPEDILPQGRYLFPLILPIAFIFVLGIKNVFDLFHKKAGQLAVALFVLFEFFFFNYVVWNYLIPVFHLTVKSPHPGI